MSKPLSVLLIEDSENDAELMLRELRRQGFAPAGTRVDTGEALQAALKGSDWDVILSDNNMPRFSGREALKLVRELAPDIPFIVVSGTLGEEHAVEAMRAGANDFVVKTKLDRLAPVVERALGDAERQAEQRRMAEALEESQRLLRQAQKLEAVGRLAGGVAHDFNNLIGAIMTYADLLLRGLHAKSPYRPDVEEIKNIALRAAALSRQLLEFGGLRVTDTSDEILNLNDVIRQNFGLFRRLVGSSIRIVVQCDPGLWLIKNDERRIGQVLMNLVVNARDAMPNGGVLSIITSNALVPVPGVRRMPKVAGEYVLLVVKDTGEGMPTDVQPKVFEPFFTTKPTGEGTGLGLAIVHGIVQQSGGTISFESVPGTGTAFSIYLPRASDEACEASGVEQPAEPSF